MTEEEEPVAQNGQPDDRERKVERAVDGGAARHQATHRLTTL